MNWEKVIDRAMDSGKDHPKALLFFLVKQLGKYPDAFQAIPDAVRDLGNWYSDHADALEKEKLRRFGADVVNIAEHGEGRA